jgi:hypothetical protein
MDQDKTAGQTPPPAPALTPAREVGASLKATRISRGYSLESVCQHTRISRKFLEALEDGRFDDLPAPVYLRSFLAGYCEYLELDLRPLWDKLHPSPVVAAAAPAPAAPPRPAAHPRPSVTPPHNEDDGGRAAPATTPLESSPYFNALISSMGAIVLSLALALGLAWWTVHGGRHTGPGPASEESARPQALQPVRTAIEPKLVLACRDDAWVQVKADGIILFAGRLPKNAHQEFLARKSIWLRTSAPEDLVLTLNGAPYRLPRPDDAGEYRIESP